MDGTLNLSSAAERFLVGLVLSYVGVNLLAKLLESYFSTSNQTEAHDEQD